MASGRRKRLADILALALSSSGLSTIPESDRAVPANQTSIFNFALYSSGGYAPLFTEGSTTLLSDVSSNKDNVWNLLGYYGETDASSSAFIPSNVVHRYVPLAGQITAVTQSTPVLLYSKDGPTAGFNQYYLPTANQINGTGSITFSTDISGAAAGMSKLRVYVAGAFPTGSTGAVLTVTTGTATPLITYTSSSAFPLNVQALTASLLATFADGINAATNGPPSSGDQIKFTFPAGYAGLAESVTYTLTVTGNVSSPAPTGYNAYVSASSANNYNNYLLQLINTPELFSDGTTGYTGSSSLWSNFSTIYLSGSGGGSNGVSVFAREPGVLSSRIAVSGSNNKYKKVGSTSNLRLQPYYVAASFNTASMGAITITYSSSATTATLNSFAPGIIVYITGSNF